MRFRPHRFACRHWRAACVQYTSSQLSHHHFGLPVGLTRLGKDRPLLLKAFELLPCCFFHARFLSCLFTPLTPTLETKRNLQGVRLLAERGCDLSRRDIQSVTPAFFAAQEGHAECLAALLSLGAPGGVARADGATPLIISAQNGHDSCVAILLDPPPVFAAAANRSKGADGSLAQVRYRRNTSASSSSSAGTSNQHPPPRAGLENRTSSGYTALCMAVIAGQRGCAELLLSAGAHVDAVDGKGRSPLYLAAAAGDTKMCGVLIDHGANARQKSPDGVEPTIAAAMRGHLATAEKIVKAAHIDPVLVVDSAGIPLSRYLADLNKRRGGSGGAAAAAAATGTAAGASMGTIDRSQGVVGRPHRRHGRDNSGGSGGGKRVAALLPASVARLRASGRPIASPPALRGIDDDMAEKSREMDTGGGDRSDQYGLPPAVPSARRSSDNRGAMPSSRSKERSFALPSPTSPPVPVDYTELTGMVGAKVGRKASTPVLHRTWSGVHGGEGSAPAGVETPSRRAPVTQRSGERGVHIEGWAGEGRYGAEKQSEHTGAGGGKGGQQVKRRQRQQQQQPMTLLDRMAAFLFDAVDVKRPGSLPASSEKKESGQRQHQQRDRKPHPDRSSLWRGLQAKEEEQKQQKVRSPLEGKKPKEVVAM